MQTSHEQPCACRLRSASVLLDASGGPSSQLAFRLLACTIFCSHMVSRLCLLPFRSLSAFEPALLSAASEAQLLLICTEHAVLVAYRCFPAFEPGLLNEVVSSAGLAPYNTSTSLFSGSFSSASERLQRYIADIHKGILIILVSGSILHQCCFCRVPCCGLICARYNFQLHGCCFDQYANLYSPEALETCRQEYYVLWHYATWGKCTLIMQASFTYDACRPFPVMPMCDIQLIIKASAMSGLCCPSACPIDATDISVPMHSLSPTTPQVVLSSFVSSAHSCGIQLFIVGSTIICQIHAVLLHCYQGAKCLA